VTVVVILSVVVVERSALDTDADRSATNARSVDATLTEIRDSKQHSKAQKWIVCVNAAVILSVVVVERSVLDKTDADRSATNARSVDATLTEIRDSKQHLKAQKWIVRVNAVVISNVVAVVGSVLDKTGVERCVCLV